MNLRDLRYLVAVVDQKHFGRAAELCHVSQPTLSAQIKKLEEYLGVTLIERTQRSVKITDIGEQIAQRARLIIHEADELVESARASRDPFTGELRVGTIPTVGPYLLPHVLKPIRTQYPSLKLKLYEQKTDEIMNSLVDGSLDVGILADLGTQGRFELLNLYEEKFVAAVPEDFPASKRGRMTLGALKAGSLLLLDEGHCLRDQALDVCNRVQIAEETEFRATSLETLRNMVAAGSGVTLMPALAVDSSLVDSPGIRIHRFKDPEPSRQIIMAWRATSARIQTIEAIGKLITTTMKNYTPALKTPT